VREVRRKGGEKGGRSEDGGVRELRREGGERGGSSEERGARRWRGSVRQRVQYGRCLVAKSLAAGEGGAVSYLE
jgi:hypothetical protein